MNLTASVRVALSIGVLLWFGPRAIGSDGGPSLTLVIPGINDHASATWVATASAAGAKGEHYAIVFDNGKPKANRRLGRYFKDLAPAIDKDHLLRVNPEDPASLEKLEAKLREIASKPRVTVTLDMDILKELKAGVGERLREDPWGPQTHWAGAMAARIAEQHIARHPNSQTQLIAHSAGCDAMLQAHEAERLAGKVLFNRPPIAMSPRDPLAHPPNTLMILADGDFVSSPGGNPIVGAFATPTAEQLQASGYTVLRIQRDSLAGRSWPSFSSLSAKAMIANIATVSDAIDAHAAVRRVEAQDQRMMIYPGGTRKSGVLPATTLGSAVQGLLAEAAPATPGRRAMIDPSRIDAAVRGLRKTEPTPGIGGVSLSAVAEVPIDSDSVSSAGYLVAENRLFLRLRNGGILLLPLMDAEILRECWEIIERKGGKPELSIGSPPQGEAVRHADPGAMAVYYLGHTEGTMLGLVLFQADVALGALAFSPTVVVQPVSQAVPGFHSLPEIYPFRYSEHPHQDRYPGAETIFLHSAHVPLVRDDDGALQFGPIEFRVRFNNSTMAEEAFGAFFASHFDAIARTELGTPLGTLVPYARACAVFRWIRENGIPFDAKGVEQIETAQVFTPAQVRSPSAVKLEEIAPRAPITIFCQFGPERFVRPDGKETRVSYTADGLPESIERHDATVLRIHRDALGRPLGLVLGPGYQGAFYVDPELGSVFGENLEIVDADGEMSVRTWPGTLLYPSPPDEMLTLTVLSHFMFEEVNR